MTKKICQILVLTIVCLNIFVLAEPFEGEESPNVAETPIDYLIPPTPEPSPEGIIYDTTYNGFTQTGTWNTANLVGYDGQYVSISDTDGSEAIWDIAIKSGFYKMYVWNCLSDKGILNGKIEISCTTITETKRLNFQVGMTGWSEVGLYNISDGKASVTVSGEGGRIMVSALKFVPENEDLKFLVELFKKVPNAIFLKIGSKNAFVDGTSAKIADVAPIVEQGRTLLPMRFVAEAFGAKVDWNDQEQRTTIFVGDKVLVFQPENPIYLVNGEEMQLDIAPTIRNGRMLLPLRAVAENIGKQVFWDDAGLIVIANEVFLDNEQDKEMIISVLEAMSESE